MRIIFFGSDDFAARHLESLMLCEHTVSACVTAPDKAKGRGMFRVSSPVKECAERNHLEVLQPEDLRISSFIQKIKKMNCD